MISILCEASCGCCDKTVSYRVPASDMYTFHGLSVPPPLGWRRQMWDHPTSGVFLGLFEACETCVLEGKVKPKETKSKWFEGEPKETKSK